MLGSAILATCPPLVLTTLTTVSHFWFTDSEKNLIIAIANMAMPFGNIIAFVVAPIFFQGVDEKDSAQVKNAVAEILWF